MAIPTRPRRPLDPLAAAEAVFKPAATPPPPATTQDSSLPQPRELVSLRIDRGVLEHFQVSNFVCIGDKIGVECNGVPMGDALSNAALRLYKWGPSYDSRTPMLRWST